MYKATVLWKAAWHELDQSLNVGERDLFHVVKYSGGIRFATGLDESSEELEAKIISISNSELGSILKIDTKGLSYKFYTNNKEFVQIEAEENPGLIENLNLSRPELIDTAFYIELEIY